jgi:hypothetical protein
MMPLLPIYISWSSSKLMIYSDHLKLHVIKPCTSLDSKDWSLRERVDIIARMSCYDVPKEIYIYIYIYIERERERERERESLTKINLFWQSLMSNLILYIYIYLGLLYIY